MKTALLIVDIQNDFCPGGSLEVKDGDTIIQAVNELAGSDRYDIVVATQDWHPANHGSFASQHNAEPFSNGKLDGEDQIFWPDHCIQNSEGANFHPDLNTAPVKAIFRKGMDELVDSYSGFFDNKRKRDTGLRHYLSGLGVEEVHVCGLAADVCVKFTASDSLDLGFKTILIEDCTKAIDDGDFKKFIELFQSKGGIVTNKNNIIGV